MPRTYGKKPSYLKPAKLPQKTLVEIGRIVRAVAEIEDLVDLHICNLAGLSESKATVLLGKTAITRRLEMAKYLAQMLPQEALDIHNAAFGTVEFLDIVECRNAVAHGKLLGKNDEGMFSFLTANTAAPTDAAAIRITVSYSHGTINLLARMAEDAIPRLEKHLKVQALREERLQRPLSPHRKGLPQQAEARKRPPRSSRTK